MNKTDKSRKGLPRELIQFKYLPSWIAVAFYRLFILLPRPVRQAVGRGLGRIAWRQNKKRRSIIDTNLSLCFPELSNDERDALNKNHFEAMGRTLCDVGVIWFSRAARLNRLCELEGWEHYEAAKATGRNVILHVAHAAGLDFGAYTVSTKGLGVGPYNPLKNPVIDWLIQRGRERSGGETFERNAGMLSYTRALKKGRFLFTLSDEDHGPEHSVFVPFFANEKATLPMIGRLSKLANAAVLPVMTYYDKERKKYITSVQPPIADFPSGDAETDARALNAALEDLIRKDPAEYMWTLRLFKTRRDGSRIYNY